MKRFSATLRALCVLVPVTAAADPGAPTLDPVVITAARVATPDTEAPFASEVHTRDQIEASGATSLYDYLARHTSVNVLPSFGNRFTPKLDMRGYGIGDGYQNLVVTVDGRRLNNIDMMPQLIGAIPLADVERIEITKGSGAVLYGDGAMAGAIHIITRAHTGAVLAASAGNFGAYQVSAGAGLKRPGLTLFASVDDEADDGHARADVTGHKDAARDRTWRGQIEATPTEALKLALDLAGTRIDTRYPGPSRWPNSPPTRSRTAAIPTITSAWTAIAGVSARRLRSPPRSNLPCATPARTSVPITWRRLRFVPITIPRTTTSACNTAAQPST
jgi:iron complex outermembrane receptor protein